MVRMRTIPVVAALLLAPWLCWSDTITLDTEANVNILGTDGSVTTPCYNENPTFSSCLGSAILPGTSSEVTYNSNATAAFGVLRAFAQGSTQEVLSGPTPQLVNIAAVADFTDTLTFDGQANCGGFTCQASGSGTVQLQIVVGGTDQYTHGQSISGYCINAFLGSANSGSFNCTQSVLTSGGIVVSPPLPIVFGQSSTFTIGLTVYGHLFDFSDPNVSFEADYNHTATLAGFIVDDSNGQALTSFSVTSGSGTEYPDTAVPEPSTLLMLAAISAPVAIRYRRQCPTRSHRRWVSCTDDKV